MEFPIAFREITLDDAEIILRWRTSARVTRFMSTDVAYDLSAQRKWLASCYDRDNYYHWIITYQNVPVGLVNLADYSRNQRCTSWGFYVGATEFLGYGGFVPPYVHNFIFESLKVGRIDAEVFYDNTAVIKLHLLHGYKFNPAKDRVLTKNGKDVLMVAMVLDREIWRSKPYGMMRADFPITRWTRRPQCLELVESASGTEDKIHG